MLDFESQFDLGAEVELALLLTYAASLAHFERELLPGLTPAEGRARLVDLLDHQQHEETFAEAAALHLVGVDYLVQPIRLPDPGAVFRLNLYLLVVPDRARLLIGSPNLTIHGCRRNLEIIDRFEVGAADAPPADAATFLELAGLLEVLPRVVALGGAVATSRRRHAGSERSSRPSRRPADRGCFTTWRSRFWTRSCAPAPPPP